MSGEYKECVLGSVVTMSNNSEEVLSDLQAATSSTDSRWLPGAGPLLKRGVEASDEKSDTTSTQIADISNRSKRISIETAAGSVEKELSDHGSTPSFESQTEDLGKFHAAVEGGNYSINFKADVNALDEDGKPPLFYAIENVDIKMTKLLLNNGAEVDNFPELLHLAASKKSIEIVEALLQQGADVNLTDEAGNTVLYSAVSTACEAAETDTDETTRNSSIYDEFVEIFNLLLRFNADVNWANDDGSTPLHCSARNGNVEITTLLLNKGADINATVKDGNTPLHLAVIEGQEDIVKLLVERGAKMDCNNNCFGQYPLHLASVIGHTRIIETLLDFGHCIDVQTTLLRTPLHSAAIEDHEDVVKLLLDRGARVNLEDHMSYTPLHRAAKTGNTGIIDALLKSGACVNAKTGRQETPLHYAIYYGREEAVRLLLEMGAKLDTTCPNGETPLCFAAYRGYSEIIEILMRFGACVNARSRGGKTALHVAARAGKASAVSLLLDNGADISMRCTFSYTPFNYAWGIHEDVQSRGEYYAKIARNMLRQKHDTIDAFFRHQVKMEAAGLNPTASDSPFGQQEGGLEDFYFECQLEIARLNSSFIASTRVSYFDIVKKCTRLVAKCLKNENIMLAMEFEDFKTEFPIYAGIIGFKVREGLARKKLIEGATCVFQRIRGWPEDCTEKVLDFLDDEHLKVFLEV